MMRRGSKVTPWKPVQLPESLTTPFYEALLEDDVETVRKLIAATPSLTQTAFEGAEFDPEIASVAASLLGEPLGPLNPLQLACVMECVDCALELVKASNAEELMRRSQKGNTPLHLASFSGLEEVVTALLKEDVMSRSKNLQGFMPIDCAPDDATKAAFSRAEEDEYDDSSSPAPESVPSIKAAASAVLATVGLNSKMNAEASGEQTPMIAVNVVVSPASPALSSSSSSSSSGSSSSSSSSGTAPSMSITVDEGDESDDDARRSEHRKHFSRVKGSFDDRASAATRVVSLAELPDIEPPFRALAFNPAQRPGASSLKRPNQGGASASASSSSESLSVPSAKGAATATPRRPSGPRRVSFDPLFVVTDYARNNEFDLIYQAIERGECDVNYRSLTGVSSLSYAAEQGNLDAINELLDLGADIDIYDDEGWTPLHTAAYSACLPACELLIERGADITKTNSDGHTAADVAENDAVRASLVKLGVKVTRPDSDFVPVPEEEEKPARGGKGSKRKDM